MSEPGQGDGYLGLRSSMAETRLRAADLGAQLGVSSCPEKCHKSSPRAGRQPFSGKSFYLDLPAGKTLQFLTGAIQQLGGVIEGFLSKEVSYIVSSRREAKAESGESSPRVCLSPSEVRVETPPMADPRGSHARASQSPADLVPMSRGKELLQKAIRKQRSSPRHLGTLEPEPAPLEPAKRALEDVAGRGCWARRPDSGRVFSVAVCLVTWQLEERR
uniref:DBF4 zinc finger B n=1 Tax=Oryctolagus cuniculus TaxID=9986 RepID=A0A5F9C3I4_RABIT